MPALSLVVPVYNEEAAIPVFIERVVPILEEIGLSYEIIFIDDGSSDGTVVAVAQARNGNSSIKLLSLSRNFGKEAAMTAGLDWCTGDAVVPMDVDLQDPPELLREFVRLWREGFEVVFGQRIARDADTSTKRVTAGLFYRIFNAIADRPIDENAGDYRLMSRQVIVSMQTLRERNRFMKGLFSWVGFKTAAVPYSRPPRAAGETKFKYWKLWNFALDGITSFSTVPLKIWTYVGSTIALAAVIYTVIVIAGTLVYGRDVPGYASLMAVVLVLGAVQLISLGIIGEYLSRLYLETKHRPIYLLQSASGFAARPDWTGASAGLPPLPDRPVQDESLSTLAPAEHAEAAAPTTLRVQS